MFSRASWSQESVSVPASMSGRSDPEGSMEGGPSGIQIPECQEAEVVPIDSLIAN